MTTPNELRLLPWSGPGGKPCYLSTDDPDGYMSRLADNIEAIQLGTAEQLLKMASETLDDEDADPIQLRRLGNALACALKDVLRVAVGREQLVPVGEPHRI